MRNLLAEINLFDEGELKGYGPLGENVIGNSVNLLANLLSSTVGLITVIGFIWFVILVVTGAIGIMTAGGDKNALQTNAKKITNGLIGLVILIAGIFLVRLFGTLMGIPDVLKLDILFEKLPIQ